MFVRALIAFLALPGIVALAVPVIWLWLTGRSELTHPLGLILLLGGVTALLWCVRDFYVSGKGTLAPWAPPTNLVMVGLYQYTRNPMYIAVTLIILGWATSFGVLGMFFYAIALAVAFHLRVVFGEEPWLANTHGAQWQAYSQRVPRWF